MKTTKNLVLITLMFLLAGCALFQDHRHAEIYDMSFDQTYMVAIDALEEIPYWRLVQTDHHRGLIVVERANYLGPERKIRFIDEKLIARPI